MARNRNQKRGGIGGWIVLAALAWFGVNTLMKLNSDRAPEESAPVEPAASTLATTQDPRYAGSYARSPQMNTWPPLAEGSGGQAQTTTNYMVVLDGSGSMAARECSGDVSKLEAAVVALERFVQTIPDEANVGLAVFDQNGVASRVDLGVGNRDAFIRELRATRANGGTPLRSAIELGFAKLTEQAQAQLGYGDYHLVVVTDGYPDPASEDPASIIHQVLTESPVIVHTIGFCIGEAHVLNQPGRVFYVAADSPDQLAAGLSGVLAEAPEFDVTDFQQN